jgi:hypothetical protein
MRVTWWNYLDVAMQQKASASVSPCHRLGLSGRRGVTGQQQMSINLTPTDGYVLEIDGKYKTEYQTLEDALKGGLELKKKFPFLQVYVYDAKERTRTLVSLSE